MIYGYLRVSTDTQDSEVQRLSVEALASRKGLSIDIWINDDGISGAKEPEERQLGRILKKIQKGDVLLASELSRLGRKMFMIMRILEHCMKVGCKVYTAKDNYELGDDIQSRVLAFAFGLSAEIERNLISQRTKEGLVRARQNGKVLGYPKGKKKTPKLKGQENFIINLLNKGKSRMKIARKLKIHRETLNTFIKEYMPEKWEKIKNANNNNG